jgi:hypothetical protein
MYKKVRENEVIEPYLLVARRYPVRRKFAFLVDVMII